MALFVVAYPKLSDSDRKLISDIRARNDRQFEIIKPHITLVFPVDNIDSEKLCKHVEKVLCQFSTTELSFKSASVVYGKYEKQWYLFLMPDIGNEYIKKLHDALYTGVLAGELRSDIPFIPHITIGIFDNPTELDRLAEQLNRSNFIINSEITAIDVVLDEYGIDQDIIGTKTIKRIDL